MAVKECEKEILLSNYEVFGLVEEMEKEGSSSVEFSPLIPIRDELSSYFAKSCCSKQNADKLNKLLTALDEFPVRLTRHEKLMICNTPPSSGLELSVLVKDCEERLNGDQLENLLVTIQTALSDS